MKLNGSLLEKENCESQYLLVAMRCVLVPTNDLQLEVSNDRNWNIVITIILMHLFLDGFYCCYSSCVCCPVCSSYSPVDPFIDLRHIISLLCRSSCFLIVGQNKCYFKVQSRVSYHKNENLGFPNYYFSYQASLKSNCMGI